MKNLFLMFCLLLTANFYAQSKGTIKGAVKDKDMGLEPLPFVSVYVEGNSSIGTTTDFDGNYSLSLLPGKHIIVFDFVGYNPVKKQIDVKEGKIEVVEVEMEPLAQALEKVILKAKKVQNTEAAVLKIQKEATVTLDAISSEAIKKTGASNVAAAVKAVTGVSVEGGKYVVVRGLNDRYTKTLLNGAQIPGLDPDKNAVQLDLFPTGILDNVSVIKSGSAEYPADFTGGVVDIITKSVSGKRVGSFNIGFGYNPNMNFKSNFLSYSGSNTDFLGFDNGNRDIPIDRFTDIPSGDNNVLRALTSTFNSELRAKTANSFLNSNFGATYGNSIDVGSSKLGFLGSFAYNSRYTLFENALDQTFVRQSGTGKLVFDETGRSEGTIGVENTSLTLSTGVFLDTDYSNYKLKILHVFDGESSAQTYDQAYYTDPNEFESNISANALLYTERSFTNFLLTGSHRNEADNWSLKWLVSPTLSKADDLNHRITRLSVSDSGEYTIETDQGGLPVQLWRLLDEINVDNKLDLANKHSLFGSDAKLKFGGAFTWKKRDFGITAFEFTLDDLNRNIPNGDPDYLLLEENVIDPTTGIGTSLQTGLIDDSNDFSATQITNAAYISEEFKMFDKLKTILGLRIEQFRSLYTGFDVDRINFNTDLEVINTVDLFPSANLIYEVSDKFNIRSSYGKTTARPSFKESSNAAIGDPITDRIFNGNLELRPTYIDNVDVRFEYYGDQGLFLAASGFYKNFVDPIELTYFRSAPTQVQPRNLGDANVYGLELEARFPLTFITEGLSFNVNYSKIESALTLNISGDEYQGRYGVLQSGQTVTQSVIDSGIDRGAAILGETASETRNLQGQSPYIVNAGISYKNDDSNFNTALTYNVQGETLEVVGTGFLPDVFTQPFHSLNLTASKAFGEDAKHKLSARVINLLGDEKESVFSAFDQTNQIYSYRDPGTQISLSYSHKF